MANQFKVSRADALLLFRDAISEETVLNTESALMFLAPGSTNYESFSSIVANNFDMFVAHIGLKKYMLDTSKKFRFITELDVLAQKKQSRLIKNKEPARKTQYDKVVSQINEVVVGIMSNYVLLAGMFFVHGGYSITNAHKKAYKLTIEYGEKIINKALEVHGYSIYAKIEKGATVAMLPPDADAPDASSGDNKSGASSGEGGNGGGGSNSSGENIDDKGNPIVSASVAVAPTEVKDKEDVDDEDDAAE